jgi:SAM-dependent methyltransferase
MNATSETYVDRALQDFPRGSALTHAAKRTVSCSCPLCASTSTFHAFTDSGCKVRACDNCGLFFVDPYPRPSDQHHQVASQQCPGIDLLDCARRYDGERLYYDRHFESIADECTGAHSILDVGCGTGNLLERLASRFDCYRLGIELNPSAARLARNVASCEILESPFETFRSARKFDVITMINVFSHISSFHAMFESLRAALAPNGRVILRTTEMSRRVSRWNQVHWGVPDDLHFLGLNTLDFLCRKYGFTVARHVRVPFEHELFRLSRWQQMGRSRAQNAIKHALLRVPGALATLRSLYTAGLGNRLFVSFIVLTPIWEITRIPVTETLNTQHTLAR